MKVNKIAFIFPKNAALGLGHFYKKAFDTKNYKTEIFTYDFGAFERLGRFNFLSKIIKRQINFDFSALKQFSPELIIIMKGDNLNADFLAVLKNQTHALLWNFYTDHPFASLKEKVYDSRSRLSIYDMVWTYSPSLVPIFYQLGAKRVSYIPFGYDPEVHFPIKNSDDMYNSEIAYLGSWGNLQEYWLSRLARKFDLKIYGGGWKRVNNSKELYNCWQKGLGYGEKMKNAIAGSKMVFNIIRAEHGSFHSMKTFELMACGGCVISNRTPEQEAFFTDGKDIIFFDNEEELIEKINYYLAHDSERAKIIETALQTVHSHTYLNRVEHLIKELES